MSKINNFCKLSQEGDKKSFFGIKNLFKEKLDTELKLLIKNSSWVFLANFIVSLCMFLRSVILARILGVEIYGTFFLIIAFVFTIQEFFNLNIGTALIKFGAGYITEEKFEKFVALVKTCFLLTGLSAIISIAFVAIVCNFAYGIFIEKPGLELYVVLFAVGSSLSFFDYISASILRLFDKFRLNSLIVILMSFVDLVFVGLIAYLFPKQLSKLIFTMVCTKILRTILINGVAFWELRKELLLHMYAALSEIRSDWKNIRSFIINNSLSRTLKSLTSNGDVLILGVLSGSLQVGYYGVAKKLAFIILRVTDPMRDAIYPQIASLISRREVTKVKNLLIKITKISAIPLVLVFIFLLFFNNWVIISIYGADFQRASIPFLFLFIAASISSIFFWSLSTIFSLGKVKLRLVTNLVSLLIGICFVIILTPTYGAIGVAIAFLITELIKQFTFVWVTKKKLD